MQESQNMNSKKTMLPKRDGNLDAKVKAPETDQVSFETAPASNTAEKCAETESLQVEGINLNETILETVAEPKAQEAKIVPESAN